VTWRILADAVLLLHCAFIAFVTLGGLLVLRRPRLAWAHLPAVAWGAGIALVGGVCPLTPLENRLRMLGGEAGYSGGFINHYLTAVIYPAGLTRGLQVTLALLLLAINLGAYLLLWRRWRG
jgi:Protein of Unknown function (DUF2784)